LRPQVLLPLLLLEASAGFHLGVLWQLQTWVHMGPGA